MARKSVPSNGKSHNGYSADEFQRQLLNWFQDRGLLSDLQAHLRHQMIVALRDTSLNINSAVSFHQAGSPKLQAINLLVAEFLLRQECHYTLSVFTSEVPLLRNLPEFSSSINNGSTGVAPGTDDGFPGFHERDVYDILEALGFSPNTEESQRINDFYEQSHGESLLTCLIRCLPEKFHSSLRAVSEKCENSKPERKAEQQAVLLQTPLFNEEIQTLMLELDLGSQQITQIHTALKRLVGEEVEKVKTEEELKYRKKLIEREERIQTLWKQLDEKLQEKQIKSEEKFKEKQLKFTKELHQKQTHLTLLASQLREQQNEVANRLNYVHERSNLLEQKEMEVKVLKKESEEYLLKEQKKLEEKEKEIEQQLIRLHAETQAREQERKELEANRIQIEQASRAIRESQSEIALLRDLQRQHSISLKASQEKSDEKQPERSRKKKLEWSSQATQVDLSKHKGAIPKKHNAHQQTLKVYCEDQSLQTQISGTDMDDVFMHLRAQSTENERHRSQHDMMSNMIDHLELENSELRGHVAQQRQRIEELTAHASQLMQNLNEANNSIMRSRNQPVARETDQGVQTSPMATADSSPIRTGLSRNTSGAANNYGCQVPLAPPQPRLAPGMRTPSRGFVRSNQFGAGEESYFSRRLPPDSYIPLYSPTFKERRKPPRRLMIHSFSSSEDSSPSPTEEMLREAHRRLRKLEEETAAVDRNYQEFRMRQVDSLTNTASILFQPVSHELNANLPTSGTQNVPARPVLQNVPITIPPTSSRGRMVGSRVTLVNNLPSATIVQPHVINTTFFHPSIPNEQGQRTFTTNHLGSRTTVNTLYPVRTERMSIPSSGSWKIPTSVVQAPSFPSGVSNGASQNFTRGPRDPMHLPAAYNFHESSSRRAMGREAIHQQLVNNQPNQNLLQQQQELPPCIVSVPHIPVTVLQSDINVDRDSQLKPGVEKKDNIESFPQINSNKLHQSAHSNPNSVKFEVIKEVSMGGSKNIQRSLLSAFEEIHPTKDESHEMNTICQSHEKGSSEHNKILSVKSVYCEDLNDSEPKDLENIPSETSTGNSINSFIKDNDFSEKLNENKLIDIATPESSANNILKDTHVSEESEKSKIILQSQGKNHTQNHMSNSSPVQNSFPLNTVKVESVQENDEEPSRNDKQNGETKNCDISVPLISEPDVINISNNDSNIQISTKLENETIQIVDETLLHSSKEHSKSPSSPSALESVNEVSSDVISAGSVGGQKSDDTW